ncbi:MAG: hypothetical protein NVSMB14_02100 [Isosphaeraceae bacterium]
MSNEGLLGTKLRKIAMGILAVPIVVFAPFQYWVYHWAGGWFVSTDLEPEHRAVHLEEAFALDFLAICALTTFIGVLIFYLDKYRPRLTVWLLIPTGLLFLPAAAIIAITVQCYFNFSINKGRDMVQIALVVVAVGLIILGIKGFTKSGLALSKEKTLTGRPAKIVGACCIFAGTSMLIAFVAFFVWIIKTSPR